MILQLDKIRKEYEGKVAVDSLSLEVPKGVIYGVIGPNGAGKTTTIRMIMNITIPDSGQILFQGKKVDNSFLDKVGYLPEERGLYKKMTLNEVINYMAALKGYDSKKVSQNIDKWLKRVDLIDYKEKKVDELSKGMQQKLQFITTIMHEPEIIILDEIFSGLDPINMELIKSILMDLKDEGKTILFSTHVMEQAEKLCDHLCMISKGNKVLDGTLTGVKSKFGKNSIQVDIEGNGRFIRDIEGVRSMTEFNNYIEIKIDESSDTNKILKAIADQV
ncbi:MAG: ATP-binding cassette domain-containing protein, partial [Calditrichaeota bacterium]